VFLVLQIWKWFNEFDVLKSLVSICTRERRDAHADSGRLTQSMCAVRWTLPSRATATQVWNTREGKKMFKSVVLCACLSSYSTERLCCPVKITAFLFLLPVNSSSYGWSHWKNTLICYIVLFKHGGSPYGHRGRGSELP
jgi:hypothetical protein